MRIKKIETRPFGTNAYVLVCPDTKESVLIDAPGEAGRIKELLSGSALKYILITHSHMDHTGALEAVRSEFGAQVASHQLDAPRLPVPADVFLSDGDKVTFGKIALDVVHTPGHTPGSLCFLHENHLFSGDTIFPHGPGRTNTPEDFRTILTSLQEKIFVLSDDVQVYPGHGEKTVLKNEKEEFRIFSEHRHNQNLCGDVLWLAGDRH